MFKSLSKIGWWLAAMLGPLAYVAPMLIPLALGNYVIEPWIHQQSWPGWSLVLFWLLYTGISTGVTFVATISLIDAIKNR